MKYIMLRRQCENEPQDIPIIFPEFLNHRDVYKAVRETLALSRCQPVSAGTCAMVALSCDGKSDTLGLPSREDVDRRTINCYDYSRGVEIPTDGKTELMVMMGSAVALTELLKEATS
jgi:hypothetical protein